MRNFQSDLNKGVLGQQLFQKLFATITATDGRKGDLLAPNGDKIELKSDNYGLHKSHNFFMERYSSVELQSPGGPWQAQQHGCKYFVYFYANELTGYVWHTDNLVQQLQELEPKLTLVQIRNKRWITGGYKVARNLLEYDCKFTSKEIYGPNTNVVVDWGFKPTYR